MVTNEQVTSALRKIGQASGPTEIANQLQADVTHVGYRLRAMLEEKAVIAGGKGRGRVYALPDQKLDAKAAPPQSRRAPAKRKKRAAAKKDRKAPLAPRPAERFIPTVDVDLQLHIINGADPVSYSASQTEAIATLLFNHYKA